MTDFTPFPKIPRLNREVIITEKIDGSNAAIVITDAGYCIAQSRKRFITPDDDNFGFAAFVRERADELAEVLGPGVHFGEWYGSGIQRGYGLTGGEKYFALFNVSRWTTGGDVPDDDDVPGPPADDLPWSPWRPLAVLPDHITTVPVIGTAPSLTTIVQGQPFIDHLLDQLEEHGSFAFGAQGFPNPEGVIIYHTQGNLLFKATLHKDEEPKGCHR